MKGKYGQRYFIIHLFIAKLKSQQTKSLAILTFDFYVSPRMLRYKCDSCVRRSVLLMFFYHLFFTYQYTFKTFYYCTQRIVLKYIELVSKRTLTCGCNNIYIYIYIS